jgi:hypothetical protein
MIKALTKSDNSFVNTFFGISLLITVLSCVGKLVEAWWYRMSTMDALAVSIISFILWVMTLGLYRLFKS